MKESGRESTREKECRGESNRGRERKNKSYFFMSTSVALCREVLPSYTDIAR